MAGSISVPIASRRRSWRDRIRRSMDDDDGGWTVVLAAAFAIAIFLIDTFTPLDVAIAVLYVAVVLMTASVRGRRAVTIATAGCMSLTLLSFLISHEGGINVSVVGRCLMSMTAIAATGFLALKRQSYVETLQAQALLLDLSHDAIFVRDMNDVVIYWSAGAEQLYGWPAHEALGKRARNLLQTTFPLAVKDIEADLLRHGRWDGELVHTTRAGTKLVVESRWSLHREGGVHPTAIMETNTDVSRRHHAEESLHHAQLELAHAARLATLGELTASLAHEVNQPLAAIVTHAQASRRWLDRPVPQFDEARAALDRVVEDGMRVSSVITSLRALSRKTETLREPVDLNELVRDTLTVLRTESLRYGVTPELSLARALPRPLGNKVQLQQVLINLLTNALQAMADQPHASRRLNIRTMLAVDDRIEIQIEDSGPGIAEAMREQVFNPFFTTKRTGMGIGLSICRSIIEAHEGHIWIGGDSPSGAVFHFILPGPVVP